MRVFLLSTDERSNGSTDVTTADACAAANANNVTVHCSVNCNDGDSGADYCNAGSIRDCTGGLLFPVVADYGPILADIAARISQVATVRYRSSNPASMARSARCASR